MKPIVLCLVGPTSSGKTSLALKIAALLPRCAIFSVDSRQAYRDLSLLTGKDIPPDLSKNIHFYGTDLLESDEIGNVSEFVNRTVPLINDCLKKSIPVILVGGSGLYFLALTSHLSDLGIPPDKQLREELSLLSLSQLQVRLKELDHVLFDRLNHSDIQNPRRLIRHIEKLLAPKSLRKTHRIQAEYLWIGLSLSKQILADRIKHRIDSRLEQGVIEEVSHFIVDHPIGPQPIYTSLGLRDIVSYLHHDLTIEEMKSRWLKSEIDYARRQMVWFKKLTNIIWYDESKDRNELARKLAQILKRK